MMKSLLKGIVLAIGVFSTGFLFAQPTWTSVLNTPFGHSLTTLNNGYVFGTGPGGMKKSPTGAPSSFTSVTLPNAINNSAYYKFILGNDNLLFISTYNFSNDGHGIYMSSDNGVTWTQKNNGLGGDTCVFMIQLMANGVMVALTSNGVSYKVYRSADYGNNWTFIQTVGGYMGGVTVRSPTEAYMTAIPNVYKSINNGLTWSIISTPTFPISEIIILSSGIFYGTIYNSIMSSSDNGVTWIPVTTTGLPASFSSGAFLKAPGDTVYYGNVTGSYGLFYSVNGCIDWNPCMTGLPSAPQMHKRYLAIAPNGYMFASPTGDGIFRTDLPVTNSSVGITEELFSATISVYPNPTADKITINGSAQGTYLFTLYDEKGAMVFSRELSAEKAEIDLSAFAPGNYLLEINDGTKSAFKKIVRK
jgi:hypothetical protein